MKIIYLILSIYLISGCDYDPKILEIDKRSQYFGHTYTSNFPIAYIVNLPRIKDVPQNIAVNSSILLSPEVDLHITEITNNCTNCLDSERLISPLRISYINQGIKFTVIDEFEVYSNYGFPVNPPSKTHMLILKDDNSHISEISLGSFTDIFLDKPMSRKSFRDEEKNILKNIEEFNKLDSITFNFCLAGFIKEPRDPEIFFTDFNLQQNIELSFSQRFCHNGYKIVFKSLDAYMTAQFYFEEWGLYGKWIKI